MDRTRLHTLAVNTSVMVWDKLQKQYPRIGNMPRITMNNRLTKTAGRMFVLEREMHLSTKLFHHYQAEFVKVIIPHELIHMVDYDLNGMPTRWHGNTWKQLMVAYGLPAETYHNMSIPK